MAIEGPGAELAAAVALLGAAVVAVPLFKRIGLGSVVGYLAAGIAIGPFGLQLFHDPHAILSVAEFGVVFLLFVIGLELKPSRLWSLRRDIFGLGVAQVLVSGAALFAAGLLAGLSPVVAFVAAGGLALSSTAIVMQILDEQGDTTAPHGQKTFAILLLQDLAIVPLLTAIAFLAPAPEADGTARMTAVAIAVVAVVGVVAVVRYVLNPMFRLLAAIEAREIMTAAALLVVLGAALAMQASGLSMGMGAFIAGVLLSESTFRHELEADVEPFRGLLLGLFFLAVGMSLDLSLIARSWLEIAAIVVVFMGLKIATIYAVARLFAVARPDATRIALLLAQGGEFAFVLYTTALGVGLIDGETAGLLSAAVIVSMALTPLAPIILKRLLLPDGPSLDGIDIADGLTGSVLLIGFGRFGQVAGQGLLTRGVDVSIIDADVEMIQAAARFGFKIYYGDGTRLDVLRAAGAASAKVIAVCIDKRDAADKIVEIVKEQFPLAKLLVRSFDRGHSLALAKAGVDYEIRETFESAVSFGEAALLALDVPPEEVTEIITSVRRRDEERLRIQRVEGLMGGRHLMTRNTPQPTPLAPVRREAKPLTEETAVVAQGADTPPERPAQG